MPYDPTKPETNDTLQSSDDLFRADKAFMKAGLEREHHFDGTETAGASGNHLVHKMGSARVFIYDNVTELTTGTLAATYSLSKARNTGIVVVDKPKGRIWYCWDGATDGWIEQSKIGGALEVVGNLLLSGHLTMATTKKIKVPSAENFLEDLAVPATTMNPFVHGAPRHHTLGSEGAWIRALDFTRGLLVREPKSASNLTPAALTGSFVDRVSLTYNLTGRTQNSRIVLVGIVNYSKTTGAESRVRARLTVNASPSALQPIAEEYLVEDAFIVTAYANALVLDSFDVAPGTNHTYALQATVSGGAANFFSGYLLLFDFGEVS